MSKKLTFLLATLLYIGLIAYALHEIPDPGFAVGFTGGYFIGLMWLAVTK
jgi:hypothetical protein